jgi:hypothetical protein
MGAVPASSFRLGARPHSSCGAIANVRLGLPLSTCGAMPIFNSWLACHHCCCWQCHRLLPSTWRNATSNLWRNVISNLGLPPRLHSHFACSQGASTPVAVTAAGSARGANIPVAGNVSAVAGTPAWGTSVAGASSASSCVAVVIISIIATPSRCIFVASIGDVTAVFITLELRPQPSFIVHFCMCVFRRLHCGIVPTSLRLPCRVSLRHRAMPTLTAELSSC